MSKVVVADFDKVIADFLHRAKIGDIEGTGISTWNVPDMEIDYSAFTIEKEPGSFWIENFDPVITPLSISNFKYDNITPINVMAKFPTITKKSITTTSVSVTEGLKFGVAIKEIVTVPLVESTEVDITFEMNLSSTQTQVKTEEEDITYDEPVPCPANKMTCAHILINQYKFSPKFKVALLIKGILIAKSKSNPSKVYKEAFFNNAIKYPGFILIDPVTIKCNISGVFSGVSGADLNIHVETFENGTTCPEKFKNL